MIKKTNRNNKWRAITLLIIIAVMTHSLMGLNNSVHEEYRSLAFEIMVTFNETVYRLERFVENPDSDIESLKLVYESYGGLVVAVEKWQGFIDEIKLNQQIRLKIESNTQSIFDLKELLNDAVEYYDDSIEIKDVDRIEQVFLELKKSQQIFLFEKIMTIRELKQSFAEN